jgi:hypothetical protein
VSIAELPAAATNKTPAVLCADMASNNVCKATAQQQYTNSVVRTPAICHPRNGSYNCQGGALLCELDAVVVVTDAAACTRSMHTVVLEAATSDLFVRYAHALIPPTQRHIIAIWSQSLTQNLTCEKPPPPQEFCVATKFRS